MVFGLDRGNSCSDRRCHHTYYRLLDERVYYLRVGYDFFKMKNSFRKLVCVRKPGRVVKTRGSKCCCSCFFFRNFKKRRIYWLNSSYAVDKFLQGGIDSKSLFIVRIALKLVDGAKKAFGFC